jgi:hypothetical protein
MSTYENDKAAADTKVSNSNKNSAVANIGTQDEDAEIVEVLFVISHIGFGVNLSLTERSVYDFTPRNITGKSHVRIAL